MTQQQLAQAAGIPEASIARIERGTVIFVSPNGEPGAATDGELGPGWFGS